MFTVYFSCFRTFRTQWENPPSGRGLLILTGWRSRAVTGCLVERQDWWTAGDTGPKCSDPTAVAAADSITHSLQYHKHKLTATHWENRLKINARDLISRYLPVDGHIWGFGLIVALLWGDVWTALVSHLIRVVKKCKYWG